MAAVRPSIEVERKDEISFSPGGILGESGPLIVLSGPWEQGPFKEGGMIGIQLG